MGTSSKGKLEIKVVRLQQDVKGGKYKEQKMMLIKTRNGRVVK